MIIFDNVVSRTTCEEYVRRIDATYKQRVESGLDPMSFPTRLINIDEPITNYVKTYIESRIKINLNPRWTQLQYWPVNSFSMRHVHTDNRAGDTNYTSMLYLNDDFSGGEFYTDDMRINPKVGRLTLFNGRETYHGVANINDKPRYSIIFWWNVTTENFV